MATRAPFARSSTGCSTSRVPCLRMELCSTIHSRRQRKQLRDTGLRRRRAWANLCVADHRRNDCKRMTKGRRVKADRRQGAAWPALCKTCPTACSRLRTSIQRHHILAVELLGIKCEIWTKKHLQKGRESDARRNLLDLIGVSDTAGASLRPTTSRSHATFQQELRAAAGFHMLSAVIGVHERALQLGHQVVETTGGKTI